MLLFPQKGEMAADPSHKQFYILSTRTEIIGQLSTQFRLAGFSVVEGIEQTFEQLDKVTIPASASGVVVDVGDSTQVEMITHALQVNIPRQVWCCVVGDSDSISLAQTFKRNNIHYFNIYAQQEMIVKAAMQGFEAKTKRQPVSISILGCKGGVGSTTIGYQLAAEIARKKQISTLFIQGAQGSQDLDLLFGKKLLQEITHAQKYFDLMVNKEDTFPDLSQEIFQEYNFVLFEQSINTANKEQMRHLVESSLCLVLVIDRSMASIRVARNMIENLELLQRTSHIARRLLICLNDTRPVPFDSLGSEDIHNLLNRPVDILFPYVKRVKSQRPAFSLFGTAQTPLQTLTSYVLGGSSGSKKSLLNHLLPHGKKGAL